MKNLTFIFLLLSVSAFAATPVNVQKESGTNRLTADLKIPTGKTVTVESGGVLNFSAGSSVTGFPAAPVDAKYIVQTSDSTLTNEQALSGLSTGLMQVTTATGVITSVTTSAGISGLISDESGSGALLFGTSPSITTPTVLGAITFPSGVRQTFAPNGTTPGLNVGSFAGNPSTPSNGDLWYDSTGTALKARINGSTVSLGAGGGGSFTGSTGSVDNALLRADGTGGSTIQAGGVVTLSDAGAFGFPAGVKQTFSPDASFVGLNVGSYAGVPGTLANGDIWYDSTGTALKARINGATVSLGSGGGGGSGDVVGPGSSVDGRLALFDSTTGKLLKQSSTFVETSGAINAGTVSSSPMGALINIYGISDPTAAIALRAARADAGSPLILMNKSRGSIASPTAVQSDDDLGGIYFGGYAASQQLYVANFKAQATEVWSSGVQGTRFVWAVTPPGTNTRTESMFLQGNGSLELTQSTTTTGTGTGTLKVTGGASITAGIFVGGNVYLDKTITTGGTTGAATINKNAGSVNFAAAATSLVVTNSRVTTSSIVLCTVQANDTTLKTVQAVPASGSFTLYGNAAATAETRVAFLVIN